MPGDDRSSSDSAVREGGETPRAVIVIPCFNHGRFVADAVASALHQTAAETRVVIVDDGSDDDQTPAACDACRWLTRDAQDRVMVVHQANRGLSAARNAGASAAAEAGWLVRADDGQGWSGHIVFLDADDYIEPEFVRKLAARLAAPARPSQSGRVSHAYCQERLVDKAFGIWAVPEWDPLLLLVTNLHPITALIRSARFFEAGGFDEAMRDGYEDWEFWIRLSAMGCRGVRVREPLFNWRRHSDITMVIEAVARHEQLYGQIMSRHRDLYQRHAMELIAVSNKLLRKGDANWLDENHESIVNRDLRAANIELWQDICKARDDRDALETRLTAAGLSTPAPAALTRAGPAESDASATDVTVTPASRTILDSMGPLGRAARTAAKAAARVLS